MTDFEKLISVLSKAEIEYIIVGGAAATAHGASRLTEDLDIVYRRTTENISRIVFALNEHRPYPRGAPSGLPFIWDAQTIKNGVNFTLTTSFGAIDLLGEITGGGNYNDLLPDSVKLQIFGFDCLCLSLEKLIHVKRAAGRPKDFEAIAELETIMEERKITEE